MIPSTIFIFCKDIIEIDPLNFQSRRRRGRSNLPLRRRDIYRDSKLVETRHVLSQHDHLQINCDPSRWFNYSVSPNNRTIHFIFKISLLTWIANNMFQLCDYDYSSFKCT